MTVVKWSLWLRIIYSFVKIIPSLSNSDDNFAIERNILNHSDDDFCKNHDDEKKILLKCDENNF